MAVAGRRQGVNLKFEGGSATNNLSLNIISDIDGFLEKNLEFRRLH
jgi:hypothetical protein